MAKKTIQDLDFNQLQIKNVVVHVTTSGSVISPKLGQIIYDTAEGTGRMFTTAGWVNFPLKKIGDIPDVNDGSLADGYYLVFDTTTSKWVSRPISFYLYNANDVNLSGGLTDGQVLTWDAASTEWIAGSPAAGLGINTPGDNRLVTSGATEGQNLTGEEDLKWDGSQLSLTRDSVGHSSAGIDFKRTSSGSYPSRGTPIGIITFGTDGVYGGGGMEYVASEDWSATKSGMTSRWATSSDNNSQAEIHMRHGGEISLKARKSSFYEEPGTEGPDIYLEKSSFGHAAQLFTSSPVTVNDLYNVYYVNLPSGGSINLPSASANKYREIKLVNLGTNTVGVLKLVTDTFNNVHVGVQIPAGGSLVIHAVPWGTNEANWMGVF